MNALRWHLSTIGARTARASFAGLAIALGSSSSFAESPPATPVAPQTKKNAPRLSKAPELIEFVEAQYPESEKAQAKSAAVVFEIAISATGAVEALRVIESAGPAFDAAASEAVKRFRFTPAEVDGAPARVRIRYRYEFLAQALAPLTASLVGSVRDAKTHAPLAGVRVELDSGESALSDADGHFEFARVSPGEHTLLLSRADLRPLQTSEAFEAGKRLEASYEIESPPAATSAPDAESDDLEIVIVVPKLTKQVVSTEVKAEEATRVAGTQGDVLKIVENLPGVTRATAGSGQLVVWGASPADTRVLLDGVELPALYHYGGVRSVVHGDLVRAVELVPGGYGAPFGRGTGGLVRVDSRDPPSARMHESVQLDLLDASAAATGPLSQRLSASASVRKSYLGWILDRVSSKNLGEFFPIPSYADGQARLRYQPDGKGFVELGGLFSSDRVTDRVTSDSPSARKSQTRTLDFERAFVRYQREPGDGSRVVLLPWFGVTHRSLHALFSDTPTSLSTSSTVYGLRASYEARLHPMLTGTLGLDLELSVANVVQRGSVSSPPREGDAFVFGQAPPDQINFDSFQTQQGSAAPYVEVDFAPFGDRLHVVPGARLEPMFQSVSRRLPSDGTTPAIGASRADIAAEPRVSVRYKPSARATLKAAFGRYHQAAAPEDLSSVFGNPLLGPQSATHWLGGAEVTILPGLELETTAFYTRSNGLAARNPIASPLVAETLVDRGAGRAFGAQFLLRRELARGLFGWVSYTLLRSERRDPGAANWRLFDFDQTHILTALAAYDLGAGFDFGVRFRYATGYPRTPVLGAYYDARRALYEPVLGEKNSSRIPAFAALDARLSKRFHVATSEIELYLDVQNVTNRENPEEIAYSPDYSTRRYVLGLPILPVIGARWSH